MKYHTHIRGFTLVETLVAVAILTVAMVGPYTVASHAITAAFTARDELVASGLAQEGVEYVRNVRDSNYLYNAANPGTPVSWLNGLSTCTPGPCVVDAAISPSAIIAPLYLSSVGLYNQRSIGTISPFTRSVSITSVPVGAPTPTEVLVTVTVSWSTARVPHSVTVKEHITNWQ